MARDLAVKQATLRRVDGHVRHLIGGMINELAIAQLALADMMAAAATNDPCFSTTNRVFVGRTLVARGVLASVDLAMQAAGGAAFYRRFNLERLFRDAQGARYHPLQEGVQRELAARIALGEDPDAAVTRRRSPLDWSLLAFASAVFVAAALVAEAPGLAFQPGAALALAAASLALLVWCLRSLWRTTRFG